MSLYIYSSGPSLSAEKDDILRKIAEGVNELKRRSDDATTIVISSITTGKRKKLAARYGAWEQVSWITFTDFPAFGSEPLPFTWGSGDEDSHAQQYTDYIRDDFLGSENLANYVVKDVHANKRYWNSGIARGTTDVVVFEPKAFREQDVIKLAIELKR